MPPTGVQGTTSVPKIPDEVVARCAEIARAPGEPWDDVVRRMLQFAAPAILNAYVSRATGGDNTKKIEFPGGSLVTGMALRRVLMGEP